MPQYVGGGTATSSFYHPTPSPADSGVMSPMTPGSSCGSAGAGGIAAPSSAPGQPPTHSSMTSPEQFSSSSSSSSSSGSPYFSHPSPADSGFACSNASPYALTSPASAASCCPHEAAAATAAAGAPSNLYENIGSNCGNRGGSLQPQCSGHSGAIGSAAQMQNHWAPPLHMPQHHHHDHDHHHHHHRERPSNVRKLPSFMHMNLSISSVSRGAILNLGDGLIFFST